MVQVIETSPEEKLKMYMKLPKKQIAKMLVACNVFIDSLSGQVEHTCKDNTESRKITYRFYPKIKRRSVKRNAKTKKRFKK